MTCPHRIKVLCVSNIHKSHTVQPHVTSDLLRCVGLPGIGVCIVPHTWPGEIRLHLVNSQLSQVCLRLPSLLRCAAPCSSGAMRRRRSFLQRMLNKVCVSLGLPTTSSRKVRFQPSAAVYEFERQVLGGGGVPDGDGVSLGLGNRCAPVVVETAPSGPDHQPNVPLMAAVCTQVREHIPFAALRE